MSAPRVVTLGETMALLRAPASGSLAHLSTLEVGIGGAESNVAIGLQRLGVDTTWISRVGDDELGHRVLREIRGEGVQVIAPVDPERPTGLMLKSSPRAGATSVHYYRAGSAASAIAPADLPVGSIEGAELLHITGITPVLGDSAREAVHSAVTRARDAGVRISLDVNHRPSLASRDQAAPILQEIAPFADIVFGGPEELSLLAGVPTPEAGDLDGERDLLRRLAERGVRQVVDKRGSDGAWVLAEGQFVEASGHRIEVLDTVGAGDAFVAGYLSAMLEGLDLADRLARANTCGALLCMSAGDWEGAARPTDLERFAAGGDPVSR